MTRRTLYRMGIKTLNSILLDGNVKEKFFGGKEGVYRVLDLKVDDKKRVVILAEKVGDWYIGDTGYDIGKHRQKIDLNLSEHLRNFEYQVEY